jgi:hypothetical protein
MTSVGPITVQVAPAKAAEDGKPSVSGIYRNKAAVEALTETFNGCGTLYELFNKTVEHCSSNRQARGGLARRWRRAWGARACSAARDAASPPISALPRPPPQVFGMAPRWR